MKNHILRIPTKTIKAALKAVADCKAIYDEVKEDRENLEASFKAGNISENLYKERLEKLGEKQKAATEKANATIEAQAKEYVRKIDEQITPNGLDLINNPDYILLKDDLVSNPEELSRIVERHEGSPAFRAAAANYALKHEWREYDGYFANEKGAKEYGQIVFDMTRHGIINPYGYNAMRCATEGEPARIAESMQLSGEYAQGEASGE